MINSVHMPESQSKRKPRSHPVVVSLHALKNRLLELTLNLLTLLIRSGLAVEVEEATKVELRLLEELDLSDVDLVSY